MREMERLKQLEEQLLAGNLEARRASTSSRELLGAEALQELPAPAAR